MRLGMSSASFYGRLETEEGAAHLRDFGLDTCEVFLETHSEYTETFGRTVREALGDMHCTSVHPKGTQFESDLFAQSERQRRDAMDIFQGVLDAGRAIGASYYVLHGPPGFKHPSHIRMIRNLKTEYGEMRRRAADYGMEILWENVSWCACRDPEDIRDLLENFPEQRFVLDVKQAMHASHNPFDILEAMGTHLAHVHVLDWKEDGSLTLPGFGTLDFPRLMREMQKMGYDGAVILEPYNYMTEDENRVRESLDYLRSVMREAYSESNTHGRNDCEHT